MGELKRHIHMEHTDKICLICGETGTPRWYEDVNRHRHKQSNDKKTGICDLCGKVFGSRNGLSRHLKQH